MQAKIPRHERMRRMQTIYFTIAAGVISAAVAASVIFFCYRATHLRM